MNINWRRNLWIIWVAQVLSLAGFNFAVPFFPYFIQELGITDPGKIKLWTGIIASAPALTMGVMAPVWGYLSDRIGKKIMLLRAMLFGSLVLTGLGLAHSMTTIIVLRLLQGLFSGTMTAAATLVSASTPRDKLSYALGMLASSSFIGMSIGPLLGGITAELLGYRTSFFVGSLSLVIGFFLVLFTVKEEKTGPSRTDGKIKENERHSNGQILSLTIIGALLMLFILRLSRILPLAFIPLHVQNIIGSVDGASSITGLISFGRGAVTALASLTIVRLGDRYPRMNLVVLLLGISTLVSLPIILTSDLIGFSVFFILGTFFLGGIEPLLQSEIVSSVPSHRQGFVFGIQTTVGNMGWFLAPLAGSLISINMGIPAVFLFMIIFLGTATGISIFISSMLSKQPIPES